MKSVIYRSITLILQPYGSQDERNAGVIYFSKRNYLTVTIENFDIAKRSNKNNVANVTKFLHHNYRNIR